MAEIRMYEYKVVPAPARTAKVKGLKTPGERFAHLLEACVNAEAADGWEFQRSETLPCEERKGFTGIAKTFQSVLIFRRRVGFGDGGRVDDHETETVHTDTPLTASAHEPSLTERPALAAPGLAATASEGTPRLSLVATRHEREARPEPEARASRSEQTARQEPVLRPGAARIATASERPEPVLRTRAVDEDGNHG